MKQFTETPSQSSTSSPSGPLDVSSTTALDSHEPPEVRAAKDLARRYRLPVGELLPVDQESPIAYDIFQEIPVDMMGRYQFLPLGRDEKGLHLAISEPHDLGPLRAISTATH